MPTVADSFALLLYRENNAAGQRANWVCLRKWYGAAETDAEVIQRKNIASHTNRNNKRRINVQRIRFEHPGRAVRWLVCRNLPR